ncbi:N-acetylglucosamine kinase-like BadF-type ATPase [Arthrobacter pigmenti]|uniref:N-acetylglucosamine kinase-like BadF-type ATPase n=1 Tax=Arthrobacter pigmenti TaxID=271432 RepID=A0A846RQ53_9MICC|nr:BadF/BadG/BcrA/BcrD ATPase family protein [Arthrobacter pigmenti]NJC21236.1 N-acetylglucosamine kinase-like BadF-type ATPase [Arthrobacter pigmenti]
MTNRGICGVDIGGTGCRAIAGSIAHEPGEPVRVDGGVRIGPEGIRIPELLDVVGQAVEAAMHAAGVAQLDVLALGLASVQSLMDDPTPLHTALTEKFSVPLTIVASDILTSHVGALSFEQGAVLAAGTGTNALGTDFASVWRRVDGWGHLLGDTGGGAWIGRQGLESAFRSFDGRGGSSLLLEALRVRFGSPEILLKDVYTRPDRSKILASFVPDMAKLADDGDTDSARIFRAAGRELATTGAAAVGDGIPPRLALVGGLFDATPLLMEALRSELDAHRPEIELVSARGTALDGAFALASSAAADQGMALNHPPYVTSRRHE